MKYYVGTVDEIAECQPKIIEIEGISIGIIYTNGNYHAIRNVCPHKQGPICKGDVRGTMLPTNPQEYMYGMEEQVIVCPWHGWEFDLETGEGLFSINDRKLKKYSIEINDDKIYVEIKAKRKNRNKSVTLQRKLDSVEELTDQRE